MFKPDMMPIIEKYHPKELIRTVRYWDKAASEDSTAYTAGVKMSLLRGGKLVVEDVVRGRWTADQREKKMRATAEADGGAVRIYVEQEPGSGGKESAQGSIKNLIGFAAYADRPTGDKIFRADPFSVQVNNGNVMIFRADWNFAYKDELAIFPFGTHKDQVDASSGAFNMLVGKKQARIIRR